MARALVTGAGTPAGIGAAVVARLRADGHEVVAAGGPGDPGPVDVTADLADAGAAAALLDAAGPVSILVNNAAHSTRHDWAELDAATLDAHHAVNVRAPALLAVELVRRLPAGEPGRIVNVVSGQERGPMPGELAYATSKGALATFTRHFAAEVAARGVTVNAVNPGPTDTGWMDAATRDALLARFPAGRIGEPGDAARLIAFLCSAEAAWITGQVIDSEGGFIRG